MGAKLHHFTIYALRNNATKFFFSFRREVFLMQVFDFSPTSFILILDVLEVVLLKIANRYSFHYQINLRLAI